MTEQASSTAPIKALLPAKIDLAEEKTQLIVAVLVAATAAFSAFALTACAHLHPTDVTVLDTVARIQVDPVFRMQSLSHSVFVTLGYGPLAVAFWLCEYFLWHGQAIGYHAINIGIHVFTAVVVAVLAGHIAGSIGRANSLAPAAALWAGLLYAVSPRAALFMIGISGQPALLCTLFSVLSILSYVRLRLLHEQEYLLSGLICFLLAMGLGAPAVIVPVVVSLAEVFLFTKSELPVVKRVLLPLPYWLVLFFLATVAMVVPGHFYGDHGIFSLSAESGLLNNSNASGELLSTDPFIGGMVATVVTVAALLAGGLVAMRAVMRTLNWKRFAFVAIWAALVFAFDRHFVAQPPAAIISSVPACLCLAFAAVPALDQIPRRQAKWLAAVGCFVLTALAGAFALTSSYYADHSVNGTVFGAR
jgi:hypothetical protein